MRKYLFNGSGPRRFFDMTLGKKNSRRGAPGPRHAQWGSQNLRQEAAQRDSFQLVLLISGPKKRLLFIFAQNLFWDSF